ncbi:desmoplakin-like isoform X1 [Halichoeres trimaculatus]|uniref:desmoplakin-like isoform X1 n=1 Tax=Halichoeres trimaculatus TaxID=147232 RepID=UPI003D9E5963
MTMMSGGGGGGGGMVMGGGMSASNLGGIHQRAMILQSQCQEYLKRAEFAIHQGGNAGDAERNMAMAKETIEQLKGCAMDLRQMGQPNDNVVKTVEMCKDQLKGVHMAISGTMTRRRSNRGSSGGWEEPPRSFQDAMGWIAQQKRLIETASWGDDPAAIDQQMISHQRFHSSLQRSPEVERARDELLKKGDKGNLHALDQEWDSLQKLSFGRTQQLQELQQIIQEMSKEIMWVNDREEEELVFDWGDKNIDQYIPRKQESYSKLMSSLEDKEKDLNKLKGKVDTLLKNNHPAADKIEAYKDTLQTQWSWLLQITKCIDTHLKENSAYSQFFKEANETYSALQKEHERVRKVFTCDKNTSLEDLLRLLKELEKEKEKIMEHKRQVQHLVNRSKNIVRLKPRNPEDKSSSQVIVKALCDFKQDQKIICKNDEAILKDNSQRSKWNVTGPGGLDMTIPSVCLIVPPPNPIGISLANKNEQYYEAILSIWNQLYINVKSLVAWQYCLLDIKRINSLTISMLANMRPEEYRQIIKSLETHFEEFKVSCVGSEMFGDEDKRSIENQFNEAQGHYETLVVQLPTYVVQGETDIQQEELRRQQELLLIQQQQAAAAEEEARRLAEEEARRLAEEEAWRRAEEARLEEERRRAAELRRQEEKKAEAARKAAAKKEVAKNQEVVKVSSSVTLRSEAAPAKKKVVVSTSRSLTELHALRLRLDGAEDTLSQHVHICLGDDGVNDCGLKISQLELMQKDVDMMREEYLRLKDRIMKELEGMKDSDKAQFLRSEIGVINQRLNSLEGSSSAYLQRLRALRDMLESVARAEDIVKVYEARLTEKETTSLTPSEVEEYILVLKKMKSDLDLKKDVLSSMEAELAKASHWNGQVGAPFHRCDMMLSKYTEQVNLLSDRWKRILGQIDTRVQDLETYEPQLQQYKQTSSSLSDWIDATRKTQNTLQTTKIESIEALQDHINSQKALNAEIKAKRGTLDSVLKDNDVCVVSVKDYETDLNSYTSGLETLLNIPIKRTMLKSPSMDLNLEATQLQTRYMELLTQSSDYYKYLGELLKNMEELKIRNTRIDMLEEQLRQLGEDIQDRNSKNKSLEDAVARIQLELSSSKDQLVVMEEVSQTKAAEVSAARGNLDSTKGKLADLNEEVARLTYLLEEEKRKKRLAEERYTQQQEEYESVLRKRQKELETVSWSKLELEKDVANKQQEIELLRRQLADEAARVKDLQREISKVRSQCSTEINNLKLNFESQIQVSRTDVQRLSAQKNEDTAELQLQYDRIVSERRDLEDELRRIRLSLKQAEDQRKRVEEEAQSQRAVITEEGRRRRELESKVEDLARQRDDEGSQFENELAEAMKQLQEKSEELVYVTHSLEEEKRRRKTLEEGQSVLEQSLSQMQSKLSSASMTMSQLRESKDELEKLRLELERESKERSRVEQNMSRLQGRMKDLQAVRDGLESQVENLREAKQDEVARRQQLETELEKSATALTDYNRTITSLLHSQENASLSEKRGEDERLRLQGDLEESLRRNKTSEERMAQLSAELRALQQQLLQEQARVKEANLKNESLYKTIEERNKALNESSVELLRLKEMTETQTKERLRLEEELRTARHDKEEALRSQQGHSEELSSQITALQLQLQTSERSNVDYSNLVSELSSEREKLKLEAEKIQKQATEITANMQSIQSKYNDVVSERDDLLLKLKMSDKDTDRLKRLEDELNRIKLSLESELRNKQRLQEESDRLKRDVAHWKDQYESKQDLIKQYDSDKDRLERDKNSLKSEIDRLMRELRELEDSYKNKMSAIQKELRDTTVLRQSMEAELKKTKETPALDASSVIFDGVRKKVTADKLLDLGILDEPTFNQLAKGHKTVPEVSADKKINLKGTGPIAGVMIEGQKGPGSGDGPLLKMTFTEAKKDGLLPPDSVDLLLDAQAATGHIIDPRTNQKYTVDEACDLGVVDDKDRRRLLAAEAAAVGFSSPTSNKPLSIFDAMKKGNVDKKTALRLLQAQEATGGILDPANSVFLPKDTAIERNLIDDSTNRSLNQKPELYMDPETEEGITYRDLKKKCKVELNTGLLLLPVPKRLDSSKLVFEGVRKPVTAKELLDCGVLDKQTLKDLEDGKKTVPQVSADKKSNLKGTGPIAGVMIEGQKGPGTGPLLKMTFTEAKKDGLLSPDIVDLLLDAQAATGHIIDPKTNQKFTVDEACDRGVVDDKDRRRLLVAESAVVGFGSPTTDKPISVFDAMKKGTVDKKTALRLLQAQEATGGILDPSISVFLPVDMAIERNLIDDSTNRAIKETSKQYIDPETEESVSYRDLKKKCKVELNTGLLLLPVPKRVDSSKLVFEGVRKPVTAKELLDCGVLDKQTLKDLEDGKKTVPEVSADKKSNLKGTGPIAGVMIEGQKGPGTGPLFKMTLTEAKKDGLLSPDIVDLLLDAQAATGHIIDPKTNQKFTVDEACDRGVVDEKDRRRLLVAESAVVGFGSPTTDKRISVFEAMRKGTVDKKTALRLLQAQEATGGILDPSVSVFLPVDMAIERNLIDDSTNRAIKENSKQYIDPETDEEVTYRDLKKKCKVELNTGLLLLPVPKRVDSSKLVFEGVRKPVTAKELLDCGVLDKQTLKDLEDGKKTVPEVSADKKSNLKGTGPIAGFVIEGQRDPGSGNELLFKMTFTEAKKDGLLSPDIVDLLLDAQAATGHIFDPKTNQKYTVDEACDRGVVDEKDRRRLLVAESAAVGFGSPTTDKRISIFEAMRKGTVDKKTALRLLQAQEATGGILDPSISVFLPVDMAIERNLIDDSTNRAIKENSKHYIDPETDEEVTYRDLKKKCKVELNTGLLLLPVPKRLDSSKLVFEGVRKPVTAKELLDCGVLDKLTFKDLEDGKKTVPEVSLDKKVFLKGTGSIAGVAAGPSGKMSFSEAKRQKIIPSEIADLLLDAQAATGHIIDPVTNQKLTVDEACARGMVDSKDRDRLLTAEAAAVGYKDSRTAKSLSVAEAMKKGLVDKKTALRLLQAQECAGGILDPNLSVFLSKDMAIQRNILDSDLSHALNKQPEYYLDLDTQEPTSYVSLKKKCKVDPRTGLLLLPEPVKPVTVQGLRDQVSVMDLVDANLLKRSDVDQLRTGRLTSQDIEKLLSPYLRGSTCIAGIYVESEEKVLPIYQAMKEDLLRPGTTLELLEAQAASGFIVDPVNNLYLSVTDAYNRNLVGPEQKDILLSAERAVTGYKLPGTDKKISLFQAIERGLVERGHGIRLLEAQVASGGIIDPEHSHRIDVDVAYKKGYFDEKTNRILSSQNADTKGFFDPNTEENLTYKELKKRCITDKKTGLILLPVKSKESMQNTLRKRRVIIVDPETNKEMSVREAYDKGLIDYDTFIELSEQECEWEEITITASDGSMRFQIVDRKTGREYDLTEMIEKGVITQSELDSYKSRAINLTQFADILTSRTKKGSAAASGKSSVTSTSSSSSRTSASPGSSSVTFTSSASSRTSASPGSSSLTATSSTLKTSGTSAPSAKSSSSTTTSSSSSSSSSVQSRPMSPTLAKMTTTRTTTVTERSSYSERSSYTEQSSSSSGVSRDSPDSFRNISSVSISLASPLATVSEQEPIGAVFDTETLEKISIVEALDRGLVDTITAQRLLEAQACTGGIVNPVNGRRLGIQEATRQGIIDEDMASKLKPAQKAFMGFEDLKVKKKMSAAEAMKEKWLPYEAGHRFLEYQFITGGFQDPENNCRRSIQDALKLGWLNERSAQKLQDLKSHTKNLTCPKTKLKISYKEALDNCMCEESTGVRMLPASSMSSSGISSPYNVSSAPGSTSGSRSGSRRGSRRGSLDLGSPVTTTSRYSFTSVSSSTSKK